MRNALAIVPIMFFLLATSSPVLAIGMVKINVKVIDEAGIPLEDVKLRV
ncbi:hypothetical protein DBW_2765 [Desulfuromonas sp. DDH964]|nr:hypothetical protein DBW_2765 [Desulfuromonas sp. DDH964]